MPHVAHFIFAHVSHSSCRLFHVSHSSCRLFHVSHSSCRLCPCLTQLMPTLPKSRIADAILASVLHCSCHFSTLPLSHADINECARNQHNCGANTVCVNTPGAFRCHCKVGYNGHCDDCFGELDTECAFIYITAASSNGSAHRKSFISLAAASSNGSAHRKSFISLAAASSNGSAHRKSFISLAAASSNGSAHRKSFISLAAASSNGSAHRKSFISLAAASSNGSAHRKSFISLAAASSNGSAHRKSGSLMSRCVTCD